MVRSRWANKVATVRSALVPGLMPRSFSACPRSGDRRAERPGSSADRSRSLISRRGAAYVLRRCRAVLANDVAVGKCGEKREIDRKRGPSPARPSAPGPLGAWARPVENIFETVAYCRAIRSRLDASAMAAFERYGRGARTSCRSALVRARPATRSAIARKASSASRDIETSSTCARAARRSLGLDVRPLRPAVRRAG